MLSLLVVLCVLCVCVLLLSGWSHYRYVVSGVCALMR